MNIRFKILLLLLISFLLLAWVALIINFIYLFVVDSAFPTWHFDGSKKIIIGNVNWFGGKNAFLGTISFLMGLIMNAAAICFLYYFKKKQ